MMNQKEKKGRKNTVTTFDPTRYQKQMPLEIALSELRRLGYRECPKEEACVRHEGGGAPPLYCL
jgi:hypothetical protein